ncbi:hypothetical protein ACFFOU_27375 [Pseudonocardia sulfidoxydans]|uniref:hypothetical protein n=1 Tax=Pseudonocardia sulfidoxydans TaxID=54011 RepID=UPI0011BD70C7|nr:hypothetical protein [Pseudonocardia sulfidoxydans]
MWFLNEPEALDDSLTGLLDGRSRTAVVELRLTKNAIEDFLLKTRGAADHGWTSEAANRWRDRCIDMEAAYNNAGHGDDWLTINVDLGAEHVDGPDREDADDARSDVYLAQLAPVAQRWVADRYQVHTPELAPEETALLDILLEGTDGAEPTISEIATRLSITLPAAHIALSNLDQRLRTTSREDLLPAVLWLRNCGDRT